MASDVRSTLNDGPWAPAPPPRRRAVYNTRTAFLMPPISFLLDPSVFLALLLALVVCMHRQFNQFKRRAWALNPQGGGASRVVLATGAASGLGRCVVQRCVARGDLVLALDEDSAGLAQLQRAMESAHPAPALVTVSCDITNAEDVTRAVEKVRAEEIPGGIDVVANFAGLICGGPLLEIADGDLERVLAVNVLGTQRVVRAFSSLMRTAQPSATGHTLPSPKIIVVASELSYANYSAGFSAPYSMSKFALEAYAASLRLELSLLPNPIDVVILNPGAMNTPMLQDQMTGGTNAFFEQWAARGGIYAPFLRRGGILAQDYMKRNKRDPNLVAAVVEEIVHAQRPAARYVIGASFEMRFLVPYVPQRLLDAGTRMQLRRA